MSDSAAIRVDHVSKAFRMHRTSTRTVKSTVLTLLRRGPGSSTFFALDDVDFVVRPGETLGIIGANGAGKSTLLSLITGTSPPTSGSIRTEGTVSSLLELGAGFHPDLTGRENVFLYGAIMGLTQRQMRQRFDSIVAFAGLEEFIDQPVKHYSSGMYVRLGFAVAVEVDPDILLVDEVLAVGDADFQRKCLAKMEEFRSSGKTMLIISHDLATIQSVSDRILLLDHGKIVGIGDPQHVVEEYESLTRRRNARALQREWGTGDVRITGVEFRDREGNRSELFNWGDPLEAVVSYEAKRRIDKPVFGFAIADESGRLVYGSNTQLEAFDIPFIEGEGRLRLHLERIEMAAGVFLFSFSVHSWDHRVNYHRVDNCFPVRVESSKSFEGCCHMPCHWS